MSLTTVAFGQVAAAAVVAAALVASDGAAPVNVSVPPCSFAANPGVSIAEPNKAPRPPNSGLATPGTTVSSSTILAPGRACLSDSSNEAFNVAAGNCPVSVKPLPLRTTDIAP